MSSAFAGGARRLLASSSGSLSPRAGDSAVSSPLGAASTTSTSDGTVDRKLKWSIATYARLKPRTAEDEELRFIPYVVHPRDDGPTQLAGGRNKRSGGRAHRPLELAGQRPSEIQSLDAGRLEGDDGDDDWEKDAGWVGRQGGKLLGPPKGVHGAEPLQRTLPLVYGCQSDSRDNAR